MAARQFIYHMQGLTKTWPGGKKVLENINLSFYPDAKIGVLGVNGSGKSTLLRIMGGIDTEFVGEGFVAEGAKVGFLPQEPQLDPTLDVKGNAMLGVKDKQAILDRYNEFAMNYSDETADEMTRLQDEIEAKGLWDLDSQVEQAMDALGCPPDDSDVATLSGGERRRVALCRLLLENPARDVVEEIAVVGDDEDRAWIGAQMPLEPVDRLGVEMVGRLVEQQEVRLFEKEPAERDTAALAARERGHGGIVWRAAERVHRLFDLAVEIP